jgi:hypothetical protein
MGHDVVDPAIRGTYPKYSSEPCFWFIIYIINILTHKK